MSESSSENCQVNWLYHFLKKKYFIIKYLGKGGFASVWVVYDVDVKDFFAIKISNDDSYNTGLNETKIYNKINKLKCNYLMKIYENFDHEHDNEKYHCFIMDLMGESLYKYIENNYLFTAEQILDCIKQLLIALNALHCNQLIHGDIKPENILLCNDFFKKSLNETFDELKDKNLLSEKIRTKVIEKLQFLHKNNASNSNDDSDSRVSSNYSNQSTCLSLNSYESNSSNSVYSAVNESVSIKYVDNINIKLIDMGKCITFNDRRSRHVGTSYYVPPETILGYDYDDKFDMWSLGCTIYEIITGHVLFDIDKHNGNIDRYHLYLMTEKLGEIPNDLKSNSKYKEIFYTTDLSHIKGFQQTKQKCVDNYLREKLLSRSSNVDVINKILFVVNNCLNTDYKNRSGTKQLLASHFI